MNGMTVNKWVVVLLLLAEACTAIAVAEEGGNPVASPGKEPSGLTLKEDSKAVEAISGVASTEPQNTTPPLVAENQHVLAAQDAPLGNLQEAEELSAKHGGLVEERAATASAKKTRLGIKLDTGLSLTGNTALPLSEGKETPDVVTQPVTAATGNTVVKEAGDGGRSSDGVQQQVKSAAAIEPQAVQPGGTQGADGTAGAVGVSGAKKPMRALKPGMNVLLDTVQKAVLKSPEVLARWETFKAVTKETDAVRGGYFPRLDITASKGRETYASPLITSQSMGRQGATMTLTQLLYDGFATRNEVQRLTKVQLVRYYELLDASETAALEALRAYYEVVRTRRLFELTEDNYVIHRKAYEHILQKVKAGVGRRVDLEQASGRLALSKSNLTLDNANIHDASARYQRIVGELPPPEMVSPASETTQGKIDQLILPNAAAATLSVVVESHPAILAAVESVRAAKYDLSARSSRYQPTINLQVSRTNNLNYAGLAGRTRDATAEVVMTWNLFNGGADRARSKQSASLLEAARDQRDKTCRDIRMNLEIAYNDISKLKEQMEYMDQHQVAIGKAVIAYQKQFEIGQRSLLDVLDSENELFQAKRTYINAQYDLYIAQARTVAGMGQLAGSLGLARLETPGLPEAMGVSSDGPETCLPEPALATGYSIEELNQRAKDELEASRPRRKPAGVSGQEDDADILDGLDDATDGGGTPKAEGGAASEADMLMQEFNPNGLEAEKAGAAPAKGSNSTQKQE